MTSTIAGCTYPTSTNYEVDFDGTATWSDNQFHLEGEVEADLTAAPNRTYEDVSIALYHENKTIINRTNIGELSTNGTNIPIRHPVNIMSEQRPIYVIIESPDFWGEEPPTSVEAFTWTGDRYYSYYVSDRSEAFEP